MKSNDDTVLYTQITTFVRQPAIGRKLRNFGVDQEDAVHDMWLMLIPYCRRERVDHMGKYVSRWAPYLIHRIIDQAAKHNRHRDRKELIS